MQRRKLHDAVCFPMSLDMKPFTEAGPTEAPAHYELAAVLIHQGSSALGGHYYAYVQVPRPVLCACVSPSLRCVLVCRPHFGPLAAGSSERAVVVLQ